MTLTYNSNVIDSDYSSSMSKYSASDINNTLKRAVKKNPTTVTQNFLYLQLKRKSIERKIWTQKIQ